MRLTSLTFDVSGTSQRRFFFLPPEANWLMRKLPLIKCHMHHLTCAIYHCQPPITHSDYIPKMLFPSRLHCMFIIKSQRCDVTSQTAATQKTRKNSSKISFDVYFYPFLNCKCLWLSYVLCFFSSYCCITPKPTVPNIPTLKCHPPITFSTHEKKKSQKEKIPKTIEDNEPKEKENIDRSCDGIWTKGDFKNISFSSLLRHHVPSQQHWKCIQRDDSLRGPSRNGLIEEC